MHARTRPRPVAGIPAASPRCVPRNGCGQNQRDEIPDETREHLLQRVREQAALLDIASDAIMVLDLEGKVLYWNHAAEKLYGWPVEEALGHNAHRLFFEEVPSQFIQAFEAVLKYG